MSHTELEKIYAGLIGMDAGMRLGAPVENPFWSYELLREYYGDIRGYLRSFRYHTADDDVNGPIIFLRALTDNGTKDLTAEMVGETWLNYTRRGMGMFWWGGEEVSTEHRAYMNLRRGVKPPRSGSIEQNGLVAAEQIGGQIFSDTWGLVCPGDPHRAAQLAAAAATVSHDGNGVYGASFVAACSAAAFTAKTLDDVLDAGLNEIPADSAYADIVRRVRDFHRAWPDDFRACRDFIAENWENPGDYHIVPNAGICVLAMLYGGGELGRAIELAVMCGYDTDCNASTIGTILGVLGGLDGVPERYRAPINDNVILSGVSGYLNVVDLAAYAKEVYAAACALRGETLPADVRLPKKGDMLLDFYLPGATHCLELSDHGEHEMRHVRGKGYSAGGCLEVMTDGKRPAAADLLLKTFFTGGDVHEDRYEPVFAPRVYPGQRVSCRMKSCQYAPAAVVVTPYVTAAADDRRIRLSPVTLTEGEWTEIAFTVPDTGGDQAHELGWSIDVRPAEEPWVCGKVFVDEVTVTGAMDYTVRWEKQREEFFQITPFAFNDCQGALEAGRLRLTMEADPLSLGCQGFTGNYYMRKQTVEAAVTAEGGAMLLLRGQGTRRYYGLGFDGAGRAVILRYENGTRTELAAGECGRDMNGPWVLRAQASGDELTLWINGERTLTACDDTFSYGMPGLGLDGPGTALWGDVHIAGSC